MSAKKSMANPGDAHKTLDEYAISGPYHEELRLSGSWLPRYFRRFHIARAVLTDILPRDASIVDIGGGEGVFCRELEKAGFHRVVGVDPFAPFKDKNKVRGDIRALPFSTESFDAITCFDVLEHIPLDRQDLAASEIARILKPGGLAVVSAPNMAHLRSRLQFLFKGRPWRNNLNKHPGELTGRERIEVVRRTGLQCVDAVGLHLTLTCNPTPRAPLLGRLVTRIMFSVHAPPFLCWTVVLLFRKPPVSEPIRRLGGLLKKALGTYQPVERDPTGK